MAEASVTDDAQILRMRLQQLELQQAQLKREKDAAEREFGNHRSIFKDLLMKREHDVEQLQAAQQNLQGQYQRDMTELRGKLHSAYGEIQTFQQMATVLEASSKEELASQQRRHHEEMNSLQHMLQASAQDSGQAETWQQERQRLEEEITRLRSQASVSATSPPPTAAAPASSSSSSSRSTLLPTLLKRGAAEDSSDASGQVTAKDIGTPDKLEVRQLKEKLRESRMKVKNLQRQLDIVTSKEPDSNKRNGLFGLFSLSSSSTPTSSSASSSAPAVSSTPGKPPITEDLKGLETCSRLDLETFVSSLVAQKVVLQDENSTLRSQLSERVMPSARSSVVSDLLSLGSPPATSHSPLLPHAAQPLRMSSTTSTSSSRPPAVQSSARSVSVEEARSSGVASPPSKSAPSSVGGALDNRSEDSVSLLSGLTDASAVAWQHSTGSDGMPSVDLTRSASGDSTGLLDSTSLGGGAGVSPDVHAGVVAGQDRRENMSLGISSPSARTSSVSSTGDVTPVMAAGGSVSDGGGLDVSSSALMPTSPPSNTLASGRHRSPSPLAGAIVGHSSPAACGASAGLCRECDVLRSSLEKNVMSLSAAESEVEFLQSRVSALEYKNTELQTTVDRLSHDLDRQVEKNRLNEAHFTSVHEEVRNGLEAVESERADAATMLEELRQSFVLLKEDAEIQVAKVQEECDRLKFELTSVHEAGSRREAVISQELDKHRELLEAEKKANISTTDHRKALEEEIASHAHSEDQLRSEVMLLQNRLQAETFAKESVEMSLQSQLQDAHLEIGQLRSAFDHENSLKQQSIAGASVAETQWKTLQVKARETISGLEKQLEDIKAERDALETRVQEQKHQMENLRAQLNTTEETSHDFVRLSQNLQVRLAQMTAQQREVRWEHENDVDECRACHKVFTPGLKKHHCRQCGKIHCAECSSKSVTRAPGTRPLRVCLACYSTITTETPVVLPSDATALESSAAGPT